MEHSEKYNVNFSNKYEPNLIPLESSVITVHNIVFSPPPPRDNNSSTFFPAMHILLGILLHYQPQTITNSQFINLPYSVGKLHY